MAGGLIFERLSVLVAAALAGAIALIGLEYGVRDGLDYEDNPPAYFSAGLLVGAALLMLFHAREVQGRAPAVFGALLAFLAADELRSVHERLEHRVGIDWQLLYAPLALLGVVVGILTLDGLHRGPRLMFLLAGAAWMVAQAFEALQWDGDTLVHPWMIRPEELLEMTGSALIVVSLLRERELRARE